MNYINCQINKMIIKLYKEKIVDKMRAYRNMEYSRIF